MRRGGWGERRTHARSEVTVRGIPTAINIASNSGNIAIYVTSTSNSIEL